MKLRPSFTVFVGMIALSALSLRAQVTTLPAQEAADLPLQNDAVEVSSAQVVEGSDFLNPLIEEEWVVLDADDKVHGTYAVLTPSGEVRPLGGVMINLGRNGVVVQTAVTEPDGHFQFSGVGIGAYALIAKAPNSVAAFALHVLPNGASNRLDSDFTVLGTSVAGPVVGEIFRAHLVPGELSPGYYPDLQIDPFGDARRFSENSVVQLTPEGVLLGRVSRPNGVTGYDLSGNVVHVLKAGRVVGHVSTNARGEFQIRGLVPGVYDFVIAGKDGVAAGGFQVVAGAGVAQKAKAQTQLVSTVNNQEGPDSLNVELVAPIDWLAGAPEFVVPEEEEFALAPVPGGGFVGPGGFGGGGMGGGMGGGAGGGAGGLGGLGGLLGIAGLAAGIAALASDDEGFNIASPQ